MLVLVLETANRKIWMYEESKVYTNFVVDYGEIYERYMGNTDRIVDKLNPRVDFTVILPNADIRNINDTDYVITDTALNYLNILLDVTTGYSSIPQHAKCVNGVFSKARSLFNYDRSSFYYIYTITQPSGIKRLPIPTPRDGEIDMALTIIHVRPGEILYMPDTRGHGYFKITDDLKLESIPAEIVFAHKLNPTGLTGENNA